MIKTSLLVIFTIPLTLPLLIYVVEIIVESVLSPISFQNKLSYLIVILILASSIDDFMVVRSCLAFFE